MKAVMRLQKPVLITLVIGGLLFAAYDLWTAAQYEMLQTIWGDSGVFWAVGRGMMNGLQPYTDLFEIKPPGIFWTSALSLWIGGDMVIGHAISAAVICLVPALLLLSKPRLDTMTIVLTLLLGTMLSSFTSLNAGEYQVEAFGSLFAIAYAVIMQRSSKKTVRYIDIAMATVAIGGAVAFKEPFLLSCVAIAMLSAENLKRFCTMFLLPLTIALILGTGIFFVLGYLDPYLNVYLAEMMGNHVYRYGSPITRGLDVTRLLVHATQFSPFFFLLLLGCIASFIRSSGRTITRFETYNIWLVVVSVIALVIPSLFHQLAIYIVAPSETMRSLLWVGYYVRVIAALGFIIGSINVVRLDPVPSRILRMTAALILATLAAGSGGEFYGHHFVFAVPVFAALMLLWLHSNRDHRTNGLSLIVITLIFATTFFHTRRDNAEALRLADSSVPQLTATEIDRILDACGQDRYMHIGGLTSTFGFTKHSPLGPLFWQRNDLLDNNHPYFQKSVLSALEKADTVLYREDRLGDIHDEVHDYLRKNFSSTPPACAGVVQPKLDGKLLFRKG